MQGRGELDGTNSWRIERETTGLVRALREYMMVRDGRVVRGT